MLPNASALGRTVDEFMDVWLTQSKNVYVTVSGSSVTGTGLLRGLPGAHYKQRRYTSAMPLRFR
jgi:hypothetical protein